jgi:tetratricopeptide (TPR) repeat protein
MNPYVYDPNLPYGFYLRMATPAEEPPVELTPREALLIGSPEFLIELDPAPFIVPTAEMPVEAAVGMPAEPADGAPAEPAGTDPVPEPEPGPGARAAGQEETAVADSGMGTAPPVRFHWGHCGWLTETGGFKASLTELKQGARTADAMWAYEQFDIARTAFRRGLVQEALEYLRRAIHGHETRGGYALDYRFHFLQGLIRLGNFRQHETAYLNLDDAEQALAIAGRYARCDHPADAGWADLAAGWAAYCAGRMDAAAEHTQRAIGLMPKWGEAHFQAAKIAARRGRSEEAKLSLGTAIGLDPRFAFDAVRDGDLETCGSVVAEAVEAERQRVGQQASRALQAAGEQAARLGARERYGKLVAPEALAGDELTSALALIDRAKAAFRDNSLCGYAAAEAGAGRAAAALTLVMGRAQKARLIAEDALQTAKETAAQVAALQIGSYRLGAGAIAELKRATALIAEAETACQAKSLAGHLAAEQHAKRAFVALRQTVEAYKASAIEQALGERAELENKIERLQQSGCEDSATPGKTYGVIGAIGVLAFGGYLAVSLSGSRAAAQRSETLMRLGLALVIVVGIGALLVALIAPFYRTEGARSRYKHLEERKDAMDQTIGRLRGFSIDRLRSP